MEEELSSLWWRPIVDTVHCRVGQGAQSQAGTKGLKNERNSEWNWNGILWHIPVIPGVWENLKTGNLKTEV